MLDTLTQAVIAKGDLAHIALFIWACAASALVVLLLREVSAANQRFDAFVRELANFNRRFLGE